MFLFLILQTIKAQTNIFILCHTFLLIKHCKKLLQRRFLFLFFVLWNINLSNQSKSFPRMSPSPGRPLKILFDCPGDVPIWHPGDVSIWRSEDALKWCPGDALIWRSRHIPGRLIRDVPRTFSGRSLEDLQCTQTWMYQQFFLTFFSELIRLTKSI